MEPEISAALPPGVAAYATRVPVAEAARPEEKVASILAMRERLPAAAAELGSLGVDVVAYACTSGSFLHGRDSDADTCAELATVAGSPALTTSTAMVAALRTMGVRRVAVVTPYIGPVADGAAAYLVQSGFEVVARRDLDLLSNLAKGRLEPEVSAGLVREVDVSGAEAVMISCTNWRTFEHLADLECETGLPVVSSNLATMWAALRLAGIDEGGPDVALLREAGTALPDHVRRSAAGAGRTG
ncbi:aspartate/glutamate racemase family protein [Nocardioides deserti]|uniref:Aspartate/glutamate racemase family protein n=1 Tax=Nocardioides deserti TaxID=1588644 RepID=A0ABR6UBA7_9ACTN|nr:aspartate/glutamate racemase family protein [Nocardioides deserti]